MASGVSSPESGRVPGIALEFPARETISSTSPKIPLRLQRRLEECKTPSTIEEIEAKLRDADVRRQQFYEKLSSRARPKPRSPSQSSSHEEDLGQRLEAKLQAAEQKRLNILAEAQMRLARLDELRQAAKIGVEIRYKKEREKLGTKVESRVQQAEANRMLLLKAYKQRRATLRERTSLSLLRRMARESKYKERVHAAICQKRLAAERKRLGLLEAEKKRARARVLQVQKIAKSISCQREIERKRMKEQLEDRLQKAKKLRAEYLRQKRTVQSPVKVIWNKVDKQHADQLSKKLARCWRRFLHQHKTTLALAKSYKTLNINKKCIKSVPFEQLAVLLESTTTLQTVKALLDRLESRLKVSRATNTTLNKNPSDLNNIDHLLKRVASPNKRRTPKSSTKSREANNTKSSLRLSRYQVRVVLCAYMILGHPDAVFSGQGEREIALAKSAESFAREFELLIRIILDGPIQSTDEELGPSLPKYSTFRSQIEAFDAAWCCYLDSFVVWKVRDARLLEEDLVRAACQLELSMIQTCRLTPDGCTGVLSHDMKAIQKQVTEDQKLLRDKVQNLSGDAGIVRMESAISDTRSKYFQAKENGSPVGSPIMQMLSSSPPSSSASPPVAATDKKTNNMLKSSMRPSNVARALFREDDSASLPKEVCSPTQSTHRRHLDGLFTENELIVNEVVHEQHLSFEDSFSFSDEDGTSIKAKIRETMENAFWDGITESMRQDERNYDRVVELMREVRDGICEIAPQSWRAEIIATIDLDILSQVLNSGDLDMGYFGGILDYALETLEKLSAPADDEEFKMAHQKLMNELAEICQTVDKSNSSYVIALIKGLRFVLEKIQALKQEISKSRIKNIEPVLRGPAGFDYLKKAFATRHGCSATTSSTSLPITVQWLSPVREIADQEWDQHTRSLAALTLTHDYSTTNSLLPSTTLKTGGSLVKGNGYGTASPTITGQEEAECKGERVDLLLRLGLLKLISGVSGVSQDALPETLELNLSRLRAVQAQFQKIIVVSTSILVLRQILLHEQIVTRLEEMERKVLSSIQRLLELLDTSEDAGIVEIVGTIIIEFVENGEKSTKGTEKIQKTKEFMARMLGKSLQVGDAVFLKVSQAVYLAFRGVLLGGSGAKGRELAEIALRQVGAAVLTDRVVEASMVLIVMVNVSGRVHGPWYANLIKNM